MIKGIHTAWFKLCRKAMAAVTLCMLLVVTGCFKEKPIDPPDDKGIGQTAVIEMGSDYANQFFYSLATNKVVSSNSRLVYDLMFDCRAGSFYIWLNTAKFMSVARTGKTVLDSVVIQDTLGKMQFYELGEFTEDSNAIGEWWSALSAQPMSRGEVYIINRGVNELGEPLGMVKMKVNDFTGNTYSVTYSDMNNTNQHTVLVQKDDTRNYRYLSFTDNMVVDGIEPDKADWDLCFTRYTTIFYDPYYLPYEVTGVLSNPSRVSTYMDSTVNFTAIQIADFDESKLINKRDVIGYTWKRYNGTYSTNQHYTFFIKTDVNRFYKLRFITFLRNEVNGYPNFEFYRL